MSSEDFFWGSVTGASIERATNHLVQARESKLRTREIKKRIEDHKSVAASFRKGSAKIEQLRKLLHEARTERDHNEANMEQFRLGCKLLKEALKKIHPDPAKIIADINRQRDDLYYKILTDKGYTICEGKFNG